MTITYVSAGAAATANNASVTPALPAGVVAGDLLLVAASIRNSGVGTVNTPAGWTQVAAAGNVAILGRFYATGVTAPVVTFAGGVANADTIARCVAFRGVSPDALTRTASASILNGSAQNITFPALDVPGAGCALLMVLWKQDDATSLATPSGWTSIGLTATTTGDDALEALFYEVQTTETDIVSGSSTVTGGAAAISRGLIAALKPAAAVLLHTQNAWPPRVQVVVSGLTVGDQVDIYRLVDGQRTLIRGGHADSVTDNAFVTIDAELPFGVPVAYVVVVEGLAEYQTATTTYPLPGGKVAMTDAITGAAAEVAVGAAGDETHERDSARFRPGGRNVVVTGPAGQAEGSYELLTQTTTALENLTALLETATEATVLIRQPGGYDGIDAYLTVDRWTVRRISQDGTDEKRTVTIEWAQTDGWPDALQSRGFTYGDVATYYTGLTYADASGDFATYLDAVQGDYS